MKQNGPRIYPKLPKFPKQNYQNYQWFYKKITKTSGSFGNFCKVTGYFHPSDSDRSTHNTEVGTAFALNMMQQPQAMKQMILMDVCICCGFGGFNCLIDNINIDKTMMRHDNDGKDTMRKFPSLKQLVAMNFVRLNSSKNFKVLSVGVRLRDKTFSGTENRQTLLHFALFSKLFEKQIDTR